MIYFNHDTSASIDDGIMALRLECGGAAVDAYWAIIEKMYRDEASFVFDGRMPETKAFLYRMCLTADELKGYIDEMVGIGLLECIDGDNGIYGSERVMETVSEYQKKSGNARSNGSRGGRPRKTNAETNAKTKSENSKTKVVSDGKPNPKTQKTKVVSDGKPYIEEEVEEEQEEEREERGFAPAPAPEGSESPDAEEVRAYFGANGFTADPDEFFDHFEAQDWVRSNGQPVADWRALARSWCRKQRGIDAHRAAEEEADRLRVERFKPPEERAPTEGMPETYDERMRREAREMGVA